MFFIMGINRDQALRQMWIYNGGRFSVLSKVRKFFIKAGRSVWLDKQI